MGLFDFFKRKKSMASRFGLSAEQMAAAGLTEADLEEALAASDSLRQHHYAFAHRVLPPLAFERTQWMMETLRSPQANEFLQGLWRAVGEDLPPDDRVEPEGLSCQASEHGDFVIALVTMPPALNVTEAHFIALAFGPLSGRGGGSSGPGAVSDLVQAQFTPGSAAHGPYSGEDDGVPLQYFTLEKGFVMPGEPPRTALCAWTAQPSHLNMGDGPPPQAKAFEARVRSLLPA